LALAAGSILSPGTVLFNNRSFDIFVRPGVQLFAIKADALPAYAEFADMRAHGPVEFVPAHPEIRGGCPGTDDTWWTGEPLGLGLLAGVWHGICAPGMTLSCSTEAWRRGNPLWRVAVCPGVGSSGRQVPMPYGN